MEYVKGETLESILNKRQKALKAEDALRIILGILPAFLYLEQAGYVYNDFKPANIMEEQLRDGTVVYKLIDLGTMTKASLTRPKDVYGTPGYHAPELVKKSGPPPSANSDRYTILRTLLQLVTNWSDTELEQHPFSLPAQDDFAVFRQHPSLYLLLEKGTRNDPTARFASGRELMEQMTGVLRQVAGEAAGIAFVSRVFAAETSTIIGVHGPKGEVLLSERNKAAKLLQIGDAALRNGNTGAAIKHYQQGLALVPQSVDAGLRLAEVLAETGAFVEAQKMADAMPEGWKKSWARARVAEMQGELDEARKHYLLVRAELTGELAPLQALARIAALQQSYQESLALSRQVVFADPSSMQAVLGLTNALWHLKPIVLEDVQHAAEAVSALSTHLEDARYYRAFGDLCYAAWKLVSQQPLPAGTVIAGLDNLEKSALARACEHAYREYLHRDPHSSDREMIVHRCFAVRSWRLF
jgi:serine/threonine-protein kinase PknG